MADADGQCKLELRKGFCTREFCPLQHLDGKSKRAAKLCPVRMGAKPDRSLAEIEVRPRPRPPVVHKQTKAAQTEAERPSKICMLAQEAHWKRDAIKGIPKKIFCLKVC